MKLTDEPLNIAPDYTICEPDKYVKGAIRAIRGGRHNTTLFIDYLEKLREKITSN